MKYKMRLLNPQAGYLAVHDVAFCGEHSDFLDCPCRPHFIYLATQDFNKQLRALVEPISDDDFRSLSAKVQIEILKGEEEDFECAH